MADTPWKRIQTLLYRISGNISVLAILIPGLVIVFVNDLPERWWVAGLSAIYMGLGIVLSFHRKSINQWLGHLYIAVESGIVITLLILNPTLSFYIILFYVLSVEAIMMFSRRVGFLWLGLFILMTLMILFAQLDPIEAAISFPIYMGGFYFFISFANATYQANLSRAESQQLLEELRAAHRQLQEYAAQAEQFAVAQERNRLAREMHDTIGHRLTVASVQLEGVLKLIAKDPAKAEKMAETVREQVREALHELRQSVATLREPLEADLPLETSLKKLVRGFEEATGLAIHLLLPDEFPPLSAAHRLALYRTAQEALTNVQKHANARQVWLQVVCQEHILTLRVSDNGKGLKEREGATGFGLRGIQERAAQLGGECYIEPRKGGGTQIRLSLPVGIRGGTS